MLFIFVVERINGVFQQQNKKRLNSFRKSGNTAIMTEMDINRIVYMDFERNEIWKINNHEIRVFHKSAKLKKKKTTRFDPILQYVSPLTHISLTWMKMKLRRKTNWFAQGKRVFDVRNKKNWNCMVKKRQQRISLYFVWELKGLSFFPRRRMPFHIFMLLAGQNCIQRAIMHFNA